MTESHPCPQCGETLEIPAAMHGRPVRCGACSNVFTPREPTAAEFDSAPIRPRRARLSDFESPAPAKSARRLIFILLGISGLLGLVCCGGLGYFVYAMMNPDWKPFDSPGGDFTAKFPGAVLTATRPTGRGSEKATSYTSRRNLMQEEFFVSAVPLTAADLKETPDDLLEKFADAMLGQTTGGVEIRTRVRHTQNGLEALDLCIDTGDDHCTQARILIATDKAYIVGVSGPGKPDESPWVQEFLDGFEPKVQPAKVKIKK